MRPRLLRSRSALAFFPAGVSSTSSVLAAPDIMFVQVVPFTDAQYSVSSSSVNSLAAVVGVENERFSIAGSIAAEGSSNFTSGMSLQPSARKPRKAIEVRPVMEVDGTYVCLPSYNPYFGGYPSAGKCFTESSGAWTGEVRKASVKPRGCFLGNAPVQHFNSDEQRYWTTGKGSTYTSDITAGAFGQSLKVQTTYGDATQVVINIHHTAKRHLFCIGGDGSRVASSAKLYVNNTDPGSACSPHQPCGRIQGRRR